MQTTQSKTRQQFPLSEKKIIKKTLSSSLVLVLGFLILIVVFAFFGLGFLSLSLLVFLATIISVIYLYQRWYFAVYFYDLTPDYIIIKKDPITPREITIPYERVQDVYVDQDILDRLLGLYDVHLSSATISSGMEAHIDGVEKQASDGLRALLLETVSRKITGKNVTTATESADG